MDKLKENGIYKTLVPGPMGGSPKPNLWVLHLIAGGFMVMTMRYIVDLLTNIYLKRSEVDKAFRQDLAADRKSSTFYEMLNEIFGEDSGFFECFIPTKASRKSLLKQD